MKTIDTNLIKDLQNGMVEYEGKKYAKAIFHKINNIPYELEVKDVEESNLVYVKNWFLNTLDQEERFVLKAQNGGFIQKETEKAYQLKFAGKYGTIIKWIPKSACEN